MSPLPIMFVFVKLHHISVHIDIIHVKSVTVYYHISTFLVFCIIIHRVLEHHVIALTDVTTFSRFTIVPGIFFFLGGGGYVDASVLLECQFVMLVTVYFYDYIEE